MLSRELICLGATTAPNATSTEVELDLSDYSIMNRIIPAILDAGVVVGAIYVAGRALRHNWQVSSKIQQLVDTLSKLVSWAESVASEDAADLQNAIKTIDISDLDKLFMAVSGLQISLDHVKAIQSHIVSMITSESLKNTLKPMFCQYLCEAIEEITDNAKNSCAALLAIVLSTSRAANNAASDASLVAILRAVAALAFMAALHSFQAGPEDSKATKIGLSLLETLESTESEKQNVTNIVVLVKYFVARMICKCTWPRDKYEALKARRVEVGAARKLAIVPWLTDSLLSLGELLTSWGYESLLEESVPVYEELVTIARSANDLDLLRLSLSRLAANDEPQKALAVLDDLIALNSSLENTKVRKEALFKAYVQKGRICSNLKLWQEAEQFLQLALSLDVDILEQDRLEIMSRVIESLFYQEKFDSARHNLQEKLGTGAKSAEIETRIRILGIGIQFAYMDLLETNPPRIIELCFERLKLAEKARNFRAEAECCDILATVTLLLQNDIGESEIYMSRCTTVFNRLHDPISIARAHMRRASVMLKYLAPRDRVFAAEALALYESALRIVRNAELDMQEKCYFEIARCFEAMQKFSRSRQFYERARKMRLRANDPEGAQRISNIIKLLPQQEDVDESDDEAEQYAM